MRAAGTRRRWHAAGTRLAFAVCLALCWRAAPRGLAGAQDRERPVLGLTLPAELHVGEHARVLLSVRLPAGAAQPLLVTPFREGAALEIVKGRLLRSDALDATASSLRFELPVLALAPGAAVIGARLLAYVCDGAARDSGEESCHAVEVETRANVVVLPR
jgi:hypothetical protein